MDKTTIGLSVGGFLLGWFVTDIGRMVVTDKSAVAAAEQATAQTEVQWERVNRSLTRIAVPGGWVYHRDSVGITFVPTPPETK